MTTARIEPNGQIRLNKTAVTILMTITLTVLASVGAWIVWMTTTNHDVQNLKSGLAEHKTMAAHGNVLLLIEQMKSTVEYNRQEILELKKQSKDSAAAQMRIEIILQEIRREVKNGTP